jgi:hypothetical protein
MTGARLLPDNKLLSRSRDGSSPNTLNHLFIHSVSGHKQPC